MGFCTYCGGTTQEGAKFCPKCGKPAAVVSPAKDALRTANSYLDEVAAVADSIDKVSSLGRNDATAALSTLDLADRQLQTAEAAVEPSNATEVLEGVRLARASSLMFRGMIQGVTMANRAESVRLIESSISLVDSFPMSHYCLGVMRVELGQREGAIEAFERAVTLDPNNLDYRKTLDRLHNESNLAIAMHSFRGSKPVLGCLSIMALLAVPMGLLMMVNGNFGSGMMMMIVNVGFWGGLAFLYWKMKTR